MSDDLNTQSAQRLFGWRYDASERLWVDQAGNWIGWEPPAYSTDPAATAQVWQWLERRGAPLDLVQFAYEAGEEEICCTVQCGRGDVEGYGASWPEALCRAALALAEALEGERHDGCWCPSCGRPCDAPRGGEQRCDACVDEERGRLRWLEETDEGERGKPSPP